MPPVAKKLKKLTNLESEKEETKGENVVSAQVRMTFQIFVMWR